MNRWVLWRFKVKVWLWDGRDSTYRLCLELLVLGGCYEHTLWWIPLLVLSFRVGRASLWRPYRFELRYCREKYWTYYGFLRLIVVFCSWFGNWSNGERRKRILGAVKENFELVYVLSSAAYVFILMHSYWSCFVLFPVFYSMNNPEKGAMTHAIFHHVLWEYLSQVNGLHDEALQEKLRREIFEACVLSTLNSYFSL